MTTVSEAIAQLKTALSGGVSPAMATPLVAGTYDVDLTVVPALVDFLIDAGVSGLFVGGTTGEGILLDDDQRHALHAAGVAAANGRVPVLVHAGTQRTETAAALTRRAAEIGADAVVCVTPWFYGVSDDALLRHFEAVAAAAPDTPFFVYDIPQFAVNAISPALLRRLAAEIGSFAGVKSSRVDVQIVRQLVDALPPDKILLAGNESAALGLLALGSDGLISGLSTAVPEPFVALTRAFAAGDMAAAQQQQRVINALLALLPAGARLGGIKRVLEERGIPVGPPTPVLAVSEAALWAPMQAALHTA
jgi:dihydrodipicolinate synthase/N-acetylneuraminate lyase